MKFTQHSGSFRLPTFSRRIAIGIILVLALVVTLLPLSSYARSHFPSLNTFHSTLQDSFGSLKDSTQSTLFGVSRCQANCPSDPYVQPGMLYFGNSSRETRWVPFPVEEISTEGDAKKLSEIDHLDTTEVEEYGAEALMVGLVDEKEKVVGWARDKYVLFIDDRNNVSSLSEEKRVHFTELIGRFTAVKQVQSMCEEAKGSYSTWGGHQGGHCHIAWLNLTIANWFFFGMADDESADWWKPVEYRPITFEERVPKVMIPGMNATGLNPQRKPDLIVLSSLFWDENYITEIANHHDIEMDGIHGFSYAQIKWHRSRIQKLIHYLRDMYDDEALPMMFRTRQIRKQAKWAGMLKIFQLDQSCRAIAKKMGLRYFTWGGKLEGFQDYYDDDQHFRNGPATWLFADMTLFYLRRAVTPGCWTCHQWDD